MTTQNQIPPTLQRTPRKSVSSSDRVGGAFSTMSDIPKLKAMDIQQALWRDLSQASRLVMPNFTPKGWWECDMLSVSKAGYWSEFEIKLSVADFKADAKKCSGGGYKVNRDSKKVERVGETMKHAELSMGSEKGPSFFWFVLPEELKDKVVIPEWAGMMLVSCPDVSQWGTAIPQRVRIWPEKAAPRLHKVKISQAVEDQAKTACYYRYWNLKADMVKSVQRELGRLAA